MDKQKNKIVNKYNMHFEKGSNPVIIKGAEIEIKVRVKKN
jgi:hypothetical protein